MIMFRFEEKEFSQNLVVDVQQVILRHQISKMVKKLLIVSRQDTCDRTHTFHFLREWREGGACLFLFIFWGFLFFIHLRFCPSKKKQ